MFGRTRFASRLLSAVLTVYHGRPPVCHSFESPVFPNACCLLTGSHVVTSDSVNGCGCYSSRSHVEVGWDGQSHARGSGFSGEEAPHFFALVYFLLYVPRDGRNLAEWVKPRCVRNKIKAELQWNSSGLHRELRWKHGRDLTEIRWSVECHLGCARNWLQPTHSNWSMRCCEWKARADMVRVGQN